MNPALERANILIQQERFDLAMREVGRVLAQDANNDTAHRLMAICQANNKNFDAATQHAEQAIHLAPSEPYNHYVLARIWQMRNYLDRARSVAEDAIALDPQDPTLYALMSAILVGQKKWKEGLQYAEKSLELDPEGAEALNLRAIALRGLGHKAPAGQELADALKLNPDDPHTHANMGWNYLHQGNHAKAKEHFLEALRIDPNLEWARVGAIESIKARNPVYRLILNYFLWMQQKSAGAQWAILIVAYVLYRIIASQLQTHPEWGIVLWPILIAYVLFALSTWFAIPLSNFALCLHPFGRLALSRREKISGIIVGMSLIVTLVLVGLALVWPTTGMISVAFSIGVLSGCVCLTTLVAGPAQKWMIAYSSVVAVMATLVATAGLVLNYLGDDPATWPAWAALWGPPMLFSLRILPWTLIGAVVLANVLNSISWKR